MSHFDEIRQAQDLPGLMTEVSLISSGMGALPKPSYKQKIMNFSMEYNSLG